MGMEPVFSACSRRYLLDVLEKEKKHSWGIVAAEEGLHDFEKWLFFPNHLDEL